MSGPRISAAPTRWCSSAWTPWPGRSARCCRASSGCAQPSRSASRCPPCCELDEQPGELAGIGPIPATLARTLAADPSGTWRRLVTDPLGQLIDYGRSTYRPPPPLARHVIARDRTCRFPHCTRTADRSRTRPHPALGRRRHHQRRKPHRTLPPTPPPPPRHPWNYTRNPDGTIEWTSPTGAALPQRASDLPHRPHHQGSERTNTDPPTDPPTEQNTDPPTDQPIDRTTDPPPF